MIELRRRLPDVAAALSLGRLLGERCRGGETLLLSGPLGAGKTTLVRGLGAGLEIERGVRSPTFQLIRRLRGRLTLHHADLYRLGGEEEEAAQLGLEELPGPEGVLAVEWPERAVFSVVSLLIELDFAIPPATGREISLRCSPDGPSHLLAAPFPEDFR
ncbi:MAG: tRNA (adenosine(37)-N6)-threonylcarbamoyltransferase complex ATPase subunit type 1 TsaE [Candidatus Coatesbacteria bacterium]|nr:tRNA (adenosine(37)-N6)-threonylcarbamoyltransferase complex ATPase subunit type 1 TsaE [Candidatus Coatesbacteria bacterium]